MTIGVAVIGLGFMGRTHIGAYRAASDVCGLTGVFDLDPDRLTGRASTAGNLGDESDEMLFDPSALFATGSLDDLLARDDVDAVSICTPTDTHAAIATRAMRAGKHVLVEKPVALERRAIEQLAADASDAGVVCMPAMCMRFWPEWAWLASRVQSDRASVRGVSFERIGAAPAWGGGFYQDDARSGGALYDLHIHDTDFVTSLFGKPHAVTSVGSRGRLTTVYHFSDGPPHVVASGGWLRGGAGFRMRYLAEFDQGTADFDLLREPPLLLSDASAGDDPSQVEVPAGDGYQHQVRAFLQAVAAGEDPPVTLPDAVRTLEVLEAESRSIASGQREVVGPG